jgi:hypothetical protein
MSVKGQSLPKRDVRVTSVYLSISDMTLRCRERREGPQTDLRIAANGRLHPYVGTLMWCRKGSEHPAGQPSATIIRYRSAGSASHGGSVNPADKKAVRGRRLGLTPNLPPILEAIARTRCEQPPDHRFARRPRLAIKVIRSVRQKGSKTREF